MEFTPVKTALSALWLLAIGAIGVLLPVNTTTGWIAVVGFGLVPAVFILRAGRQPEQTMSESIRAVTRKQS
jgi:hypothetical protein